jgi:hypothetical protein
MESSSSEASSESAATATGLDISTADISALDFDISFDAPTVASPLEQAAQIIDAAAFAIEAEQNADLVLGEAIEEGIRAYIHEPDDILADMEDDAARLPDEATKTEPAPLASPGTTLDVPATIALQALDFTAYEQPDYVDNFLPLFRS